MKRQNAVTFIWLEAFLFFPKFILLHNEKNVPLNTNCGKNNNLEQNSRKHHNEFAVVRSHMQNTSGNNFRSVLTSGNRGRGAACLESAES